MFVSEYYCEAFYHIFKKVFISLATIFLLFFVFFFRKILIVVENGFAWITRPVHPKKSILPNKDKVLVLTNKFFWLPEKNSKQKISFVCLKNIFLILFAKKSKHFISDMFWKPFILFQICFVLTFQSLFVKWF